MARRESALFAGHLAMCLGALWLIVAIGFHAARAPFLRDCGIHRAIGAPQPGIVTALLVKTGMTVDAGDPLFEIDDGIAAAELRAGLADLHQATASYSAARASFAAARIELSLLEDEAPLEALRHDIASAAGRVESLRARRDRLLVRAPVSGRIVQVHVRRGAAAGGATSPVLRMESNCMWVHAPPPAAGQINDCRSLFIAVPSVTIPVCHDP